MVGTTGCSAAASSSPEAGAQDADAVFCEAWADLGPTPSVNDAAAATAWDDAAQRLLAATPPRHRPAVEQMTRNAEGFVSLGERAGWTTEGFGLLTEGQQQDMADHADALGLFFTGPVAAYAHETCAGVADPAFEIACIGHRWFLTSTAPDSAGLIVEGTPPGAVPVADPGADATTRLPGVPGAVEVRKRDVDGTVQVTFLDDGGRSVRLEVHQQANGGWVPTTISRCGVVP